MPLILQSHIYENENIQGVHGHKTWNVLYLSLQVYTRGDIGHLRRIRSIFVPEPFCRLHADA